MFVEDIRSEARKAIQQHLTKEALRDRYWHHRQGLPPYDSDAELERWTAEMEDVVPNLRFAERADEYEFGAGDAMYDT